MRCTGTLMNIKLKSANVLNYTNRWSNIAKNICKTHSLGVVNTLRMNQYYKNNLWLLFIEYLFITCYFVFCYLSLIFEFEFACYCLNAKRTVTQVARKTLFVLKSETKNRKSHTQSFFKIFCSMLQKISRLLLII